MDQQFSLRWNNYLNQITSAFGSLRFEEDLVDVTLSCEGKKIKAHKMLLSACSTYFRDIFKENPCQHPVIVFRNVRYADLEAIVDFMYKGEVNVLQDELESFLGTAELLEVKGLTDGSAKEEEELKEMPKILPQSNSLATRQSIRQAHPVSQTPAVSLIPSSRSASPTLKKRRCETSNRLDETLESQRLAVSEISNLPVVPKIEKDYEYVEDLTFDEEDIVLAGVVDPLKSGSKSDDSSGGLQDQQEDSLITMGLETVRSEKWRITKRPSSLFKERQEHSLERLPGTSQRKCIVCAQPKKRGRSRFWCPGCNRGVHRECFSQLAHHWRPPETKGRRRASICSMSSFNSSEQNDLSNSNVIL